MGRGQTRPHGLGAAGLGGRRLKEGFPSRIAPGPEGPYEILRVGSSPSLVAFQTAVEIWIVGDVVGLERLARLADLVRERRDTVVHFALRMNAAPPDLAPFVLDPGLLDLVLAPEGIGMTPDVWREVGALPSTGRRRVNLPSLDDRLDGAQERLELRQKRRGMARRVGEGVLILSGENTAFRALAGSAAYVARVGPAWRHGEAYHVDWTRREDEPPVRIDFYDAAGTS